MTYILAVDASQILFSDSAVLRVPLADPPLMRMGAVVAEPVDAPELFVLSLDPPGAPGEVQYPVEDGDGVRRPTRPVTVSPVVYPLRSAFYAFDGFDYVPRRTRSAIWDLVGGGSAAHHSAQPGLAPPKLIRHTQLRHVLDWVASGKVYSLLQDSWQCTAPSFVTVQRLSDLVDFLYVRLFLYLAARSIQQEMMSYS